MVQWLSFRLRVEGSLLRDLPEVLCCILEQDTLSPVSAQKESHRPDMTDKLLTGT